MGKSGVEIVGSANRTRTPEIGERSRRGYQCDPTRKVPLEGVPWRRTLEKLRLAMPWHAVRLVLGAGRCRRKPGFCAMFHFMCFILLLNSLEYSLVLPLGLKKVAAEI